MNLLSQLKLIRYFRHLVVVLLLVLLLTPVYLLTLSLGHPSVVQAADPGVLSFNTFTTGSAKVAGVPFQVKIHAANSSFNDSVALSDGSGSVSPAQTDNFVNGDWTGNVVVTRAIQNNTLTAAYDASHVATSGSFTVAPNVAAATLALISGNGQTGIVATRLASALKVKTVDTFGNIISGVNVQFNVQAYPPGATGTLLSATSATTGGDGIATTLLTLGTKVGTYAVQATVNNGASSVIFFINATPAELSRLSMVPSAAVLVQSSVQQFSLTASDRFDNPISLSSVNWAVNNGGGQIDGNGVFSAGSTVGSFASTVKASVGSVSATASVTIMSASGAGASSSTPTTPIDTQRNIGILDHVIMTPGTVTAPASSKQVLSAQGYDVFNNALATISYTWEVAGSIGVLSSGYGPATLLQAPPLPANGTLTVTAVQGSKKVQATSTVSIIGTDGGKIVFSKIDSPQQAGSPFQVTFTVKDANDAIISSTIQPIILSDSTGSVSPRVVTKLSAGVWTGEVTIANGADQVVLYAATSGFAGASNAFKVEGQSSLLSGAGGGSGGGASSLAGATKLLGLTDSNKLAFAIITGLGLLGAMTMLGLVGSRGLQAIGRNPLAKKQIFFNLYLNAGIAILAAFISVALALLLKSL
jgi:F0F1-type ATP synthase membrane subunit c/vacuolar-type H+-ATPase subunit K